MPLSGKTVRTAQKEAVMQFTVELDFTEEQMEQLQQFFKIASKGIPYEDAYREPKEGDTPFRAFLEEALNFRIEKNVLKDAECIADYAARFFG